MSAIKDKIKALDATTPEIMMIVLVDELCGRMNDLNETLKSLIPRGEGERLENVFVTDRLLEIQLRYPAVSLSVDNDLATSTNDVYLSLNYKGKMEMRINVTDEGGPYLMLFPLVKKAWLRCNDGLTTYVDIYLFY